MKKKLLTLALTAVTAALPLASTAADWTPSAASVSAGFAGHGAYALTTSARWNWIWRHVDQGSEWTGYYEAYVSHWNSPAVGERLSYTQVGALPVLRHRYDDGRSPWFFDVGVGVSYMDKLYHRGVKPFSTQFNFVDVVGFGRSFGAKRDQELGVRMTHVSNARMKSPNPGETYLQVRYTRAF